MGFQHSTWTIVTYYTPFDRFLYASGSTTTSIYLLLSLGRSLAFMLWYLGGEGVYGPICPCLVRLMKELDVRFGSEVKDEGA